MGGSEIRYFPVPEHAEARLTQLATEPDAAPVEARLAVTVVLLRDGEAGPEVLLVRRAASMDFAPGVWAFPGGRVDDDDYDSVTWSGWSEPVCARRLEVDEKSTARALFNAAIRESFEEVCVLFASDDDGEIPADSGTWAGLGQRLEEHTDSLASIVTQAGLHLRPDLLHPWARWVTPEYELRRFDTYFFVAAVPNGQEPKLRTAEGEESAWLPLPAAIALGREGQRAAMLPPTLVTLEELARVPSVAAAMTKLRTLRPVQPRAVLRDGEWQLEVEICLPKQVRAALV